MKTLREHPCCGEISGKRGAPGKEMRSSNRPTRSLSSAELLGALDSAEAPKSPVCLSRDTLRGVAAQRRPEKVPMCQQLQRSIVAAPCVRWTHSKNDALLAISLIHSMHTNRRNTKSEHMCSEF